MTMRQFFGSPGPKPTSREKASHLGSAWHLFAHWLQFPNRYSYAQAPVNFWQRSFKSIGWKVPSQGRAHHRACAGEALRSAFAGACGAGRRTLVAPQPVETRRATAARARNLLGPGIKEVIVVEP